MTIAPLACHSKKSEKAIASSFTPTTVISRADTLILTFPCQKRKSRTQTIAARLSFSFMGNGQVDLFHSSAADGALCICWL